MYCLETKSRKGYGFLLKELFDSYNSTFSRDAMEAIRTEQSLNPPVRDPDLERILARLASSRATYVDYSDDYDDNDD